MSNTKSRNGRARERGKSFTTEKANLFRHLNTNPDIELLDCFTNCSHAK